MRVATFASCALILSACNPADIPATILVVYDTWQKESDLLTEPPPALAVRPNPELTLSIDADGLIAFEDRLMTIEELTGFLVVISEARPDEPVLVIAQPSTRNGSILKVRDALVAAGFSDIDITLDVD